MKAADSARLAVAVRSVAAGLTTLAAMALAVVFGWFVFDEVRVRREIRRLKLEYPGLVPVKRLSGFRALAAVEAEAVVRGATSVCYGAPAPKTSGAEK